MPYGTGTVVSEDIVTISNTSNYDKLPFKLINRNNDLIVFYNRDSSSRTLKIDKYTVTKILLQHLLFQVHL